MTNEPATRGDVVAALEHAAQQCASHCLDDDEVMTDAVLVIGAQSIDDDGDRIGRVVVFGRGGSQPPYITVGLLEYARRLQDINVENDGGRP